MADEESQNAETPEETTAMQPTSATPEVGSAESAQVEFEGAAPANLGATQYVMAAFFAAGVLGGFILGRALASLWNKLAEVPAIYESVPFLLHYAEDERTTFTMPIGMVVGLTAAVWAYRKERVKRWADEVASELTKVHWPDKETVTNGTIVVIVASAVATVYVGLLDRLWAFVTKLVYGA